ncbi:hypothetical protein HRG_001019 [Hirsutella rhossiliensis]|uniref:Uncharacterized protein n=1 Tax=Hirsutella rhossiliensis TaxID=111463 RepID=A0A9P8N8A3_9HYPO|nr:uncharacterized protein HRG_01019 [Hirsutella rhossiliensis]KAH0968377.1 hypothetical protein HRG_01019 [Hirsutella rhossiliensis]
MKALPVLLSAALPTLAFDVAAAIRKASPKVLHGDAVQLSSNGYGTGLVQELVWHGEVKAGEPNMTLAGTVQEIYDKISIMNPDFSHDGLFDQSELKKRDTNVRNCQAVEVTSRGFEPRLISG